MVNKVLNKKFIQCQFMLKYIVRKLASHSTYTEPQQTMMNLKIKLLNDVFN